MVRIGAPDGEGAVLPAAPARERTTRVIEDLGLDSLALAELVVVLMEKYGMSSVPQTLEDRVGENLTAGTLYDEYLAGGPTGRHRSSTR